MRVGLAIETSPHPCVDDRFFAGGLARLLSMVAVGLPHRFFVAMTVIELTFPVLVIIVAKLADRHKAADRTHRERASR